MGQKKATKTIAVFSPEEQYLSHCTWDRALNLLESGRATRLSATTIKLKETKRERAEKRQKIIEDAGRICYICDMYIPEDETATVDHMIPKASDRIYTETEENMKCCCYRCNNDKGNRSILDYVMYIMDHRQEYDYISDEKLESLKGFAFKVHKEYQERKAGGKKKSILKKQKSWKRK